jgi:hypothetical protein
MSAKVKNRILFVVVCFFVEAVIVWMNWSTWSDEPIEALYWALRVIALIAASLLLAPLVFRVLKALVWGYVAIGNGLARLFLGLFAENAAEKGRGAEDFLDQPLFRGFLGWMRFGDDRPFVDRALTPRRIIPWILFGWPLAVMPLLLEETLPFFLFLIGLAPFAMRQHRRRSAEVERRMVDAFTSGYRIRRARETDLDDLVKVEAASWEAACDANDMFSRAQFAAHLEVIPSYFFVAEEIRSGRLLGYVSGVRRLPPPAPRDHARGVLRQDPTRRSSLRPRAALLRRRLRDPPAAPRLLQRRRELQLRRAAGLAQPLPAVAPPPAGRPRAPSGAGSGAPAPGPAPSQGPAARDHRPDRPRGARAGDTGPDLVGGQGRLRPSWSWLDTQSPWRIALLSEVSPARTTPAQISANRFTLSRP